MTTLFGIPLASLFSQLLIGIINGSFYAMLSIGLAIIFGLLRVINFAHGAQYMLGAFAAWMLLNYLGINYWAALALAPLAVALFSGVIERVLIQRTYDLDPLYGLLLTFGIALMLEGSFRHLYGSSGMPYPAPDSMRGAFNLGFMMLPKYRAFVIVTSLVVCFAAWLLVEKTKFGAYLRAATFNPKLVQVFGINVPILLMATYALGAGLAGFAGVLAAPMYQVNAGMGQELIIVVFAVVVIGGMGSIIGSVVTGYLLGIIEGLTRVFYPEASNVVIFAVMALVLLLRPSGLFGRA